MNDRRKLRAVAIMTLIITVFTVFTSCQQDPGDLPEGMKMATNDAIDYYFYYPEAWTLDKNEGMISAYASLDDPSSLSVTTFKAPNDFEDLKTYFTTNYTEAFKANFSDMRFTEECAETTIGGYKAYRTQFVADIAGGSYKFMQTMCVRGGYIYIITFTSTEERYDEHYPSVDLAVSYITFK